MTVSYQYDVASSTSGGFTRLLFKWRGSLYKLVYRELALFAIGYITVSLCYRYAFSTVQKRSFEKVVLYCDTFMNYIPLSFILGFYVSFVASRWWQQYMAIPWPDKLLHSISLHVTGSDDYGRMMRRTLVRYINLSLVLVLRSISSAVKKRFPKLDHLVEAGFITKTELEIYNQVPNTEFNTYWVPCTWFTSLLREAQNNRRIADPVGVKLIMEEFSDFRQKCGMLWSYDWVSIPLVYTQVVTIATYAFFLASLIGRQFVEKSRLGYKDGVDMVVPFFTLLQYFFYMGLLKVAEQLINPFGDDDEDFELNWIIDRHLKVSYLIVDTLYLRVPPLSKDMFYDDETPQLPYTEGSAAFKKRTYRGSVADMEISAKDQNMIMPDIEEEVEEVDEGRRQFGSIEDQFGDSPQSGRKILKHQHSSATSGSKGIGCALLAVGKNQGVFAKGPETVTVTPNDLETSERNEIYLDYLGIPTNEDGLEMENVCYEDETSSIRSRSKPSSSFKLPSSIRAKYAMKKKPVMKWRPYVKPTNAVDEQSSTGIPTDFNGPAPVVLEDECAFMWRTIEDESCSLNTAPSSINTDMRTDSFQTDHKNYLSHYNEMPTKVDSLAYPSAQDKNLQRYCFSKSRGLSIRGRHKVSGRRRYSIADPLSYLNTSLPILHRPCCGRKSISPRLLKSISEASIFLEVLASRLQSFKKTQESSPISAKLQFNLTPQQPIKSPPSRSSSYLTNNNAPQ